MSLIYQSYLEASACHCQCSALRFQHLTDRGYSGYEFQSLHVITQSICMHVSVCVRLCVSLCVCLCAMWWRAVLSRARAECHWAHSDSLQHLCNHDAPPANERAKGGRRGLLWLSWQGEQGRWCCASLFRDVVGCCVLELQVICQLCVCVCVCVCVHTGTCMRMCAEKIQRALRGCILQ